MSSVTVVAMDIHDKIRDDKSRDSHLFFRVIRVRRVVIRPRRVKRSLVPVVVSVDEI